MNTLAKIPLAVLVCFSILTIGLAQPIPFDDERWEINGPDHAIFPYMGKQSLFLPGGATVLKDVLFTDGTIEVDFAAHGNRGFAGIIFRVQDALNYELFYIRPHKSRLPDALQYTPVFNGLSGWQLYSGEGFTAPSEIELNVWSKLKVVVEGTKADFYIDGEHRLEVTDLKHGLSEGSIGVWSSLGAVNFANFQYTPAESSDQAATVSQQEMPEGMLTEWQLSEVYEAGTMEGAELPSGLLKETNWEKAVVEADGLINISKTRTKFTRDERTIKDNNKDIVFAKTVIHADKAGYRKLAFGYSDEVRVYLNGQPLFEGISTFRARDPAFLGIVDVDNDAIYLPLKKGKNELVLAVTELFGGWGYICRLE
ncbi:MAG: hypothetical protein AAF502_04185 [Bacteroidota bacterium]